MMDQDEAPRPGDRFRRRALLAGAVAAGAGVWWGWPAVAPLFVGEFDFEPLDDPAGFRRLAGGDVSGGFDPFVGIGESDAAASSATTAGVRADICGGLFGGRPPAGVVPVASFSDYNCPFCKVLTKKLAAMEAGSGGAVRVTWHEWPLLGDASVAAARAALAADMQGAYAAFHERLMRSRFIASPEYLEKLAGDLGIDPVRFVADAAGSDVAHRLETSAALAAAFGFRGTPALVVGRTVLVGATSDAVLAKLIGRERRDGAIEGCV